MKILSIVIVSYNSREFLFNTLLSIERAIVNLDIEVIIVDNNSIEDIESLSKIFKEFKFIFNKKNIGYGKANNLGVSLANSESILILNPDVMISKSTILKGISSLNSINNIGALGVNMVDGNGKYLKESKRNIPNLYDSFIKYIGLNSSTNYYLKTDNSNSIQEIEVISGACFFIKKSVFEKLQGFDINYFMYGEDIDLSYQLIKNGYKNYCINDEMLIHFKGETTKSTNFKYYSTFYDSIYYFFKKSNQNKNIKIFFVFLLANILKWVGYLKSKVIKHKLLIFDFSLIYISLLSFTFLWGKYIKNESGFYPLIYYLLIIPFYILIWILCLWFNSIYSGNSKITDYFVSSIYGSFIIFLIYLIIPENYRYSRAVILFGTFLIVFFPLMIRSLMNRFFDFKLLHFSFDKHYYNILAKEEEILNIKNFFSKYLFIDIIPETKDSLNCIIDISKVDNDTIINTIRSKMYKNIFIYIGVLESMILLNSSQNKAIIQNQYNIININNLNNIFKRYIINKLIAIIIIFYCSISIAKSNNIELLKKSLKVLFNKVNFFGNSKYEDSNLFIYDINLIDNNYIECYYRNYKIEFEFDFIFYLLLKK